MHQKLTGKIALVTGASRGVGAAVSEALAQVGADVIINYRNNWTHQHTPDCESTGALTSANHLHELSYGGWLLLSETYKVDRKGQVYEASIHSDDTVEIDWTVTGQHNDPIIVAAVAWLQTRLETDTDD